MASMLTQATFILNHFRLVSVFHHRFSTSLTSASRLKMSAGHVCNPTYRSFQPIISIIIVSWIMPICKGNVVRFDTLCAKNCLMQNNKSHPVSQYNANWLAVYYSENALSAFAGFHQFSHPTVTGIWKGIQWVPRGKQRLPHNRLNPRCCWGGKYTAWRG